MAKSWPPPREQTATPPPLGPLLAGARARGVADGLSWLGLAAVLIDDRGEALSVNPAAAELMGASLYLDRGRLRARNSATDEAVQAALREALTLTRAGNVRIGPTLWAHIAPMPAEDDDPYQVLRAVVLLGARS